MVLVSSLLSSVPKVDTVCIWKHSKQACTHYAKTSWGRLSIFVINTEDKNTSKFMFSTTNHENKNNYSSKKFNLLSFYLIISYLIDCIKCLFTQWLLAGHHFYRLHKNGILHILSVVENNFFSIYYSNSYFMHKSGGVN